MQAPKTLKDFVSQYQENRKIMNIQERKIKIQNYNIKTFLASFIVDALLFAATLLTVVIRFIIIYMLTGQSKLKTLVANIALQRIKPIEAADPKTAQNCDFGMLKFLMILNLVIVLMLLVKFKKSKIFQGHFFSNMVKIKLFIRDTESYVLLELNKLAGNVQFQIDRSFVSRKSNIKKLDLGCSRSDLEQYPCNSK